MGDNNIVEDADLTVLPRAATSPELAYLRSDNQATRLYLTFFTPATVYTARLAAVPSSTDRVASITYSGGSGTYTDILPDMTLLIGTTAGGFDLGMARIRNTTGLAATSGTMNIGETSEIEWQANCYLTVLDEFLLWPRHPTVTSTVTYMDYDVAYVNQHRYCDSIPVLGPDRVVWLTGATVSVAFDGSQSWALNNTITDYLWTAPGASATSGLTTATPTITYNAVGTYRVGLQITNSDGAVFTGYRRVFVVTESSGVVTTFQLASPPQGSYSNGGWSFQVKMSENAALPTLRDRMQVILHSRDYYGTTQVNLGYVAGSENVRAIGWIDQESIQWQREDLPGSVTFTVEGPHYWLNRMAMFPTGIKDRNSHPTKWTRFFGLTAKAISWHLLHWRTTATRCIDVYPANNTWRGSRFDAPGSQTIWQQLTTILENSVIAKPCCDRYARLFMQVEQNLLSTTDRAAIPSVMTIAKGDWTNEVTFDRRIVNDAAYVDLSGVSWDGVSPTAFFSLSPGHVFRHYGSVEVRERLVLYDQPTTTTLCGAYWGWKNNPYPRLTFNLAMNNPMIDIAPYQYLTVDISAADTPRGFTASALRVIPRTIRDNWNMQAFALTTDIEVEAETPIGLAVTGDTPSDPPEDDTEKTPPPIQPPPPVIKPAIDAKILWMIHYSDSTNPSVAIIYEILDDLDNPVYTKIIPDAGLNLQQLFHGFYDPTNDVLMLIGYATSTPVIPGWGGGASNVLVKASGATSGSPTWDLIAWGYGGMKIVDFLSHTVGGVVEANNPMWIRTGLNAHPLATGRALDSNLALALVDISSVPDLTGFYASGYAIWAPNGTGSYWWGYKRNHTWLLYDGPQAIISGSQVSGDYLTLLRTATYDYNHGYTYGDSDHAERMFFSRRNKTTGILQLIYADIVGRVNGNYDPTVMLTTDEVQGTWTTTIWANTRDSSRYCNVVPGPVNNTNTLYYYDGGIWTKMTGTVPYGPAHYLKSSGGVSMLHVNQGTVTNGNVPARYTSDVAVGTWIDMTGNMWSGADKIIISGDLSIRDSWLSF